MDQTKPASSRAMAVTTFADLRCNRDRRDEADAAHRLERLHDRREVPALDELLDAVGEVLHPRREVLDGLEVVVEYDVVRGMLEGPCVDPPQVILRPGGLAREAPPVTEEELPELLASDALRALGVVPRPLQVADRFR
ncbi:MAG TPA: hypothetical protein VEB43_08655 [Anaeromyxobacter sp.]|nr:hypothetical protein [Anaeromyxobacter sp.]